MCPELARGALAQSRLVVDKIMLCVVSRARAFLVLII